MFTTWKIGIRRVELTRQATNVHFLKIFSLQNNDGQFSCGWDVTQRKANVTKTLFLKLVLLFWLVDSKTLADSLSSGDGAMSYN
jgi:hypothetical protein